MGSQYHFYWMLTHSSWSKNTLFSLQNTEVTRIYSRGQTESFDIKGQCWLIDTIQRAVSFGEMSIEGWSQKVTGKVSYFPPCFLTCDSMCYGIASTLLAWFSKIQNPEEKLGRERKGGRGMWFSVTWNYFFQEQQLWCLRLQDVNKALPFSPRVLPWKTTFFQAGHCERKL
jgi:hypothetical protein